MFLEKLLFDFHVPLCLKCGSLLRNASCFCTYCETHFLGEKLNLQQSRSLKGMRIYSMIRWTKGESNTLSELIYLLKKSFSRLIYASLVNKIKLEIQKDLLVDRLMKETLLVYIPTSGKSYSSKNMAEVMSQTLGIPLLDKVFILKDTGAQKKLNKKERERRQARIDVKITHDLKDKKVIFIVDDVITTGSTMLSAYEALKSHNQKLQLNIELVGITCFDRQH